MAILTISGSSRQQSGNTLFLKELPVLFPEKQFHHYENLADLPLFQADHDHHPWPDAALQWRKAVAASEALIISTPEYLHNMPALLKNAFEWISSSGELMNKAVLAITFTPHPPRGQKAMQSMTWTLQALDARIVGQLDLYQQEVKWETGHLNLPSEIKEILETAIDLL